MVFNYLSKLKTPYIIIMKKQIFKTNSYETVFDDSRAALIYSVNFFSITRKLVRVQRPLQRQTEFIR